MGKRSKAAKPKAAIKEKLSQTFNCLFCNQDNSVICKLDKKANVGTIRCTNCHQAFQTGITHLSEAVDVYSDWIDACDEVNKEGGGDGFARRDSLDGYDEEELEG
ncbi:hypothetical protein YB2330_005634 [Saitoella coloradoensis]